MHEQQALRDHTRLGCLQRAQQHAGHTRADAGQDGAARDGLSEYRSVHARAFHYCTSRLRKPGFVMSAL